MGLAQTEGRQGGTGGAGIVVDRTDAMARAGLVGNFLTDLGGSVDTVAARWRFDAGSLILSQASRDRATLGGGSEVRCQTGSRPRGRAAVQYGHYGVRTRYTCP